ncbi:MAG: cyclase family protein [Sporichthyaceae bacterium]|nr:cyclase family protein [Sporichthyaceae bacterium]
MSRRVVDLSHPIVAGMSTYPGLPPPEIDTIISREESAQRLAPGVSFHIGRLCMVANTGTYLDAPFHFHESGPDTAALAPDRLAERPVVVVDARGVTRIGAERLRGLPGLADMAVLVRTDWSNHWGTSQYAIGSPHLSRDAVQVLIDAGVALVGIDALNIDDVSDLSRPAHHGLLGAGVPIIEHMTNLASLPPVGARLTAVPPPVVGMGTMPVRAVAIVDS